MNRCLSVLGCFLAVILVIATLYATEPHTPTKVSTSELGGADRYMTYLSTDKPIYRPGETMYIRGVVLHHSSRQAFATQFESSGGLQHQRARKAIQLRPVG